VGDLYTDADVERYAQALAFAEGRGALFTDPAYVDQGPDPRIYDCYREEYRARVRNLLDALTADGWRKLPEGTEETTEWGVSFEDAYHRLGVSAYMSRDRAEREVAMHAGCPMPARLLARSRYISPWVAASPSTGEDPTK